MDDVLTASAILLGLPKHKAQHSDFWSVTTFGARIRAGGDDIPSCCHLDFDAREGFGCEEGCVVGGAEDLRLFYHFEGPGGTRLVTGESGPLVIALLPSAKRLVAHFGGEADFNEGDDIAVNYICPHPEWDNDPEDGPEYAELRDRLWALEPITGAELADADAERTRNQPTPAVETLMGGDAGGGDAGDAQDDGDADLRVLSIQVPGDLGTWVTDSQGRECRVSLGALLTALANSTIDLEAAEGYPFAVRDILGRRAGCLPRSLRYGIPLLSAWVVPLKDNGSGLLGTLFWH